jgi:hypothetical protein
VLHPNQFKVNEAWIAFRLNDAPIHTLEDGSFNCVSLMDAASCYILGAEMVPIAQDEPSKLQVRRLLKAAWAEKEQFPATLFLPAGQFQKAMTEVAASLGIVVVPVQEDQLLVFIGEAREGYKEHMQGSANDETQLRVRATPCGVMTTSDECNGYLLGIELRAGCLAQRER